MTDRIEPYFNENLQCYVTLSVSSDGRTLSMLLIPKRTWEESHITDIVDAVVETDK